MPDSSHSTYPALIILTFIMFIARREKSNKIGIENIVLTLIRRLPAEGDTHVIKT